MDSSSAGVRAKSAAISTLVQQLQRGEITKATMFARLSALKGNSGTNGATTNVDGNTASPSLNNSIRTTGNLSAYVGSTPSKADDARGDDVPRVVLSPSPVDSQVLSSPDRRQLIQQLLAEKRKVRDAAIKNANKFVGEQEGTGEQEEAREGERDGLGLSMMDLDTNAVDGGSGEEGGRDVGDSDEYNNPPPPPKQSQSGGYHNNLRAMMSGSGGDVGGGRRAAGVEMPHKKGQSQRQREQQQKQQKMVQQREKQRGEQQRSRPTTLQSLDTSPTPPPAQEPSFVNSRKASEEMKSRTLRAVNEEMMAECTFSPTIKALPAAYGKPKNSGGNFYDRTARWAKEKEMNASVRKQESQDRELEGCTFDPTTSSNSVYRLGKPERVEKTAPSTPNEQETVQRLYYMETKKLEERRRQEMRALKVKEDEDFKKSCTFKPDLSSSQMNGAHNDELLNQVEARYMHSSTEAAERRKLILSHPDIASPGPGEYEEDRVEPFKTQSAFNNFDIDQAGLGFTGGLGGLGMRGGGVGNSTSTKNWSFAPKTNSVKKSMGTAKKYLEEDVVERLTKAGVAGQHARAISKTAGEEQEDRETSRLGLGMSMGGGSELRASVRSKDEAQKDFHEFLARQNALQIRRKEGRDSRIIAETPKFTPKVNGAYDTQTTRGDFLQRVDRYQTKSDIAAQKRETQANSVPIECTFQPSVLRKSHEMPRRSVEDMSMGDAEQKEINNRALRLKVESEQLSKFSFRPQMNSTYTATTGKAPEGKLQVLRDPDSFIKRLEEQKKAKEEKKARIIKEKMDKEQASCVADGMNKPFVPKTTECPAYIKRIAHSMQISRRHREKFETKVVHPSWK